MKEKIEVRKADWNTNETINCLFTIGNGDICFKSNFCLERGLNRVWKGDPRILLAYPTQFDNECSPSTLGKSAVDVSA